MHSVPTGSHMSRLPNTSIIPAEASLAPQLTQSHSRIVEAVQTHMTRLTSLLIRSAHSSQLFSAEVGDSADMAASNHLLELPDPYGKNFPKLMHLVCSGNPELTHHSYENLSTH